MPLLFAGILFIIEALLDDANIPIPAQSKAKGNSNSTKLVSRYN